MTMPDDREDGREPGRSPSGAWVPIPDPTILTTEAVERATQVFRREIEALRELHDKDLDASRELLDARLAGMDNDRKRLWDRSEDLVTRFTSALDDFRAEVERRDGANRGLIEQRLADLDKARKLAAKHIEAIPGQIREQRDRVCKDMHSSLVSEREYVMAQIEILATQGRERFAAIDGQFIASKVAVDAALAAQKESAAAQNTANDRAIAKSEGAVKEQLTSLAQVADGSFAAIEDKITGLRDRLTTMESLTRGIEQAGDTKRADSGLAHGTVLSVIASLSVLIALASLIFAAVHH